jgi:Flp pilus assembly protein TadB
MTHAAPGSARSPGGRRDGGRRRPGKRRSASRDSTGLDTAGGDGTEPRQGLKWEQLPYWLIVAGACVALAVIRLGTHHLKSGTLVLAGVLLVAAVARLVLPDRRAGMLMSRRRWLDVAIFAALGIGLLVAGLGVPAPRG